MKRFQRLSSASTLFKGKDYHLYLPLSYSVGQGNYSYALHRIRLSDLISRCRHGKLEDLPEPILKLPRNCFPFGMGFFAVGSKIYIFGGGENYRAFGGWSRSCYIFDTYNNPSKIIKDGPPMNFGKFSPLVLGPVNGNYYVLSCTLLACNLEEFNPQTESWNALPPPPNTSECLGPTGMDDYLVFSVVTVNNKLFICTWGRGIYIFDVVLHEWEHLSSLGGSNRLPFSEQAKFLDGCWYGFPTKDCHPLNAYRFDDNGIQEVKVCGVPGPYELFDHDCNDFLVPLEDRMLCIVRSGVPQYFLRDFYVTIDMCEFTKFEVQSSGKVQSPEVATQYSVRYKKKDELGGPREINNCFVIECGRGCDRDVERDRNCDRLRDDKDHGGEKKRKREREDREEREHGMRRSHARSQSRRRDHKDREEGEHHKRHAHCSANLGSHWDGPEHHKRHAHCSAKLGNRWNGPENRNTPDEPKKQ